MGTVVVVVRRSQQGLRGMHGATQEWRSLLRYDGVRGSRYYLLRDIHSGLGGGLWRKE